MIYMLAAADDDMLIGNSASPSGMPWYNPEDLQYFKAKTLQQTIVMGANTYRKTGALPKRQTIVISSTLCTLSNAQVHASLKELLKQYQRNKKDIYICGGASIYRQAFPYTDVLLLSRIPGSHEGDTWFPPIPDFFLLEEEIPYATFTLQIYRQKKEQCPKQL